MTGVETTAERVVIRDVFPAVVTVGPDTYRSALAVITRDRLLVYVTRAAPVLDVPYLPEESKVPRLSDARSAVAHVRLASGVDATVQGQRGCGCGNPLKGWQPWRPYRKAQTP